MKYAFFEGIVGQIINRMYSVRVVEGNSLGVMQGVIASRYPKIHKGTE